MKGGIKAQMRKRLFQKKHFSLIIFLIIFLISPFSSSRVLAMIRNNPSWIQSNEGLSNKNINCIVIDPQNTQIIYAGTNKGVYKSINGGESWGEFNNELQNINITALAIDPTNSELVYAGTYGNLYMSDDEGRTWKSIKNNLPNMWRVNSIVINIKNTQEIYIATYTGIFKSTDSGKSWFKLIKGIENIYGISSVLVGSENTKLLFAATYENGIFRSNDGGSSWNQINNGLQTLKILSLCMDPLNNALLYAGTDSGVYKSTNQGEEWELANSGIPVAANINSFAIDPQNTQIIYAGTNKGVYKSINGGESWGEFNDGLQDLDISSVTVNPQNAKIIYAGTWGSGVFKMVQSSASVLDHFVFNYIDNQTANTPFNVMITAKDSSGNTVTGFTGTVTITVNKGSITPTTTTNFVNGVLSNFSVTIPTANTGVTITATSQDGKTGTSNSFNVNPVITASAGSGGSISPSGTVSVNYGDSKTFTITPDKGYKISDVKVDGKSVGAVSTYTFQNVTANHTIEATFENNEIVIVLQVGQTTFIVNGGVSILDSPPIIKNGRTLLPIRPVVEALGGTVSWDGTEKKVTVTLGSTTIELWIGKNTARVNGTDTPIDSTNSKVVPEIINGRTMLPLRFVTENLGCELQWDPNTKTITITYQG